MGRVNIVASRPALGPRARWYFSGCTSDGPSMASGALNVAPRQTFVVPDWGKLTGDGLAFSFYERAERLMNAFYERIYEQLHRHTTIAQASIFLVLACACLSLLVHAALHLRAGACWVLPKGGRGLGFTSIRGRGMGLGRWFGCGFA